MSNSNNLSRDQILAEVNTILSNRNLSKADSTRAEGLLRLADQLSPASVELRKIKLAQQCAEAGIHDPWLAETYRKVEGVTRIDGGIS